MKLVKGRTLAALLADRADPGRRPAAVPGDLRAGLPDGGLRPRPGRDPPRPEAVERDGRALRRGPGDGLGPGQGPAPRAASPTTPRPARRRPARRSSPRRGAAPTPTLSQAGSVLGTPAYMAPEQARGEVDGVDERADVFALGSILCEILTGQPAFTGRTVGRDPAQGRRAATLADALARLDGCGADAELVALAQRLPGRRARGPAARRRRGGRAGDGLPGRRAGAAPRRRARPRAAAEARGRSRSGRRRAAARSAWPPRCWR